LKIVEILIDDSKINLNVSYGRKTALEVACETQFKTQQEEDLSLNSKVVIALLRNNIKNKPNKLNDKEILKLAKYPKILEEILQDEDVLNYLAKHREKNKLIRKLPNDKREKIKSSLDQAQKATKKDSIFSNQIPAPTEKTTQEMAIPSSSNTQKITMNQLDKATELLGIALKKADLIICGIEFDNIVRNIENPTLEQAGSNGFLDENTIHQSCLALFAKTPNTIFIPDLLVEEKMVEFSDDLGETSYKTETKYVLARDLTTKIQNALQQNPEARFITTIFMAPDTKHFTAVTIDIENKTIFFDNSKQDALELSGIEVIGQGHHTKLFTQESLPHLLRALKNNNLDNFKTRVGHGLSDYQLEGQGDFISFIPQSRNEVLLKQETDYFCAPCSLHSLLTRTGNLDKLPFKPETKTVSIEEQEFHRFQQEEIGKNLHGLMIGISTIQSHQASKLRDFLKAYHTNAAPINSRNYYHQAFDICREYLSNDEQGVLEMLAENLSNSGEDKTKINKPIELVYVYAAIKIAQQFQNQALVNEVYKENLAKSLTKYEQEYTALPVFTDLGGEINPKLMIDELFKTRAESLAQEPPTSVRSSTSSFTPFIAKPITNEKTP
jgi:hypothetical protein